MVGEGGGAEEQAVVGHGAGGKGVHGLLLQEDVPRLASARGGHEALRVVSRAGREEQQGLRQGQRCRTVQGECPRELELENLILQGL